MSSTTLTTIVTSQFLLKSRMSKSESHFFQESDAQDVLRQIFHSNAKSLSKRSQSISERTGETRCEPDSKTEIHPEVEDDSLKTILEMQKGRLLSVAKSKILKYESQTGIAENYIRDLKIQSQEMEIRRANDGYVDLRSQRDQLHRELQERERALLNTQIRGVHQLEPLMRNQDLRIKEFSRRKMIKDQNTIEEVTGKVQELQDEINRKE